MIRTPTRTKTASFNGSQGEFRFPDDASGMEVTEMSASHRQHDKQDFINSHLAKKSEDDSHSQILSDYTATGSSSGNSSNGYYSFANISDNTTNPEGNSSTVQNNYNNTYTSRYSYISTTLSSANYPVTLAPDRTPRISTSVSPENTKIGASSSTLRSIPENVSALTSFCTIPTADNVSFQISLLSDRSTSMKIRKASNLKRSNSSIVRAPSTRSSVSSGYKHSKLKRSNAIRCKGGLLNYFTKLGIRIERTLRRIELAFKRKLFTYKQRTLNKKKNKKTTSHLLRSNGYFANIKRSQSMKSLANQADRNSEINETNFEIGNTPIVEHSPSMNQRSLRRTPSSIKRAVSVLTNNNAVSMSRSASTLVRSGSGRLVRSQPSLNLNSTIRQPSIVVNNKVIPLSNFDHEDYCITEEDEDEDEYVIDTHQMQPLRSDSSSVVSSLIDESQYEDAEAYSSSVESLPESIKVANARAAWDGYLRAVISQRISLRLQIAKFQQSQNCDGYKDLIDAIVSDYESDDLFSDYEHRTENESVSGEGTDNENYPPSRPHKINSSHGSSLGIDLKPSCASFTTFTCIQDSVRNGVKRNLTLPVGIKV